MCRDWAATRPRWFLDPGAEPGQQQRHRQARKAQDVEVFRHPKVECVHYPLVYCHVRAGFGLAPPRTVQQQTARAGQQQRQQRNWQLRLMTRLLLLLPLSNWKLQPNSCMVLQLSVLQPR